MKKIKILIAMLLLSVVSSSFAQINVGSYRILDQYLQDGKLKVNQNATETTFQYEVTLTAFMNSSTGYANPASIQITIGINGINLANSAVYSSQAKTIQSTEFPQYTGIITKTYSATIQNSHLSTGKKIDVWQYLSQTGAFQPLDRYEYDYVLYTPAVFGNVAVSAVLHKNDCGPGYTSDPFTYTVAANKYTASTQAAANALAQNEINMQGQATANAALTCIPDCNGPATIAITSFENHGPIGRKFKTIVFVTEIPGATYKWYIDGVLNTTQKNFHASFKWLRTEVHVIEIEAVTPCGTSNKVAETKYIL